MLKRVAAVLLSLLYLVTATGFVLDTHFCGDSITAVSINATAKAPAGCGDGMMKCCTNKHLNIKVKDAHVGQPNTAHSIALAFAVTPACYPSFSFGTTQGASADFVNKSPPGPPLPGIGLFIKNRVFRI
jgi:hypothetical protein